MDRGLEPQLFCRTCSTNTTHETMYRSDDEFIGKILVCEHCGETVFEPLRTGCADCSMKAILVSLTSRRGPSTPISNGGRARPPNSAEYQSPRASSSQPSFP